MTNMHSLFGTIWGLNPGPFDPTSDTLATTPPPPWVIFYQLLRLAEYLLLCEMSVCLNFSSTFLIRFAGDLQLYLFRKSDVFC